MSTFIKYALSSTVILIILGFNAGAHEVLENDKRQCCKKPSIENIGAGIGGTSCAYFLTELFGRDVKIDNLEAAEIERRLKSLSSHFISDVDVEVELDGDVLHSRNKYMKSFIKRFAFEVETVHPGRAAIYNEKEFNFLESGWNDFNYFKLIYRYCLVNQLFKNIEFTLDKLDCAYNTLEKGNGFGSVEKMLGSIDMSFPAMRNVTIQESFRKEFGDLMYEEIILPIMRVNYGQGGN
ncbi:hypothetical protein LSTR_LSTR010096 [Laodelphax striatellus]|uniref:Prenylcysteine lyase domain-containing protein n=1 Tax=Laodelphax striatellus TaxID=195883 RepID=A0A482X2Y9_LAOST|nr:hypothetical protein LSTR_LSTR010096 [Laodelphax striatellus]